MANTWSDYDQAWHFDPSKARAQADFTWLDQPGVWQEIDAYMVRLSVSVFRSHWRARSLSLEAVADRHTRMDDRGTNNPTGAG